MAVNQDDLSIKIKVQSEEAKKNLQATANSVKDLQKSLLLVSDSFKESFTQSLNNTKAYTDAAKTSAALNKVISSLEKSSNSLSLKNKDLANSYSDINKKANAQSIQEASKIYNDLQKTTVSLDKATIKLNDTLEETSNITRTIIPQTGVELVGSFNSTSGEINQTNSTLKNLNSNIIETNNGINSQVAQLDSLNSSLGSVATSINSVTTIYNTFLSDDSLKKASNLLSIFSSLADIKGFDGISEGFKKAAEQIDRLNLGLEKFRNMSDDNFESTEQKLSSLNQAIKIMNFSLIGAGATIAGVFAGQALGVIPKWSEMFAKLNSTIEGLKVGAIKAGEVLRGTFRLSMLSAVEAATMLSPGLFLLGSALQESDNAFVRFIGTAMKFTAVILGGVGSAITYLMSLLSGLIVSLGQWMVRSLVDAEEKFKKFEVTMRQFSFVIKGFSKEVGENSVGSLKLWEKQLDKIVETSNFTRSQVAKSIKLLVAEGSILGLSVEQNTKLLQLSADVAAATGTDLEEVTQRILTSISQNASAVLGLGIDIREHNIAHSEFIKQSGLAVNQLTKEEQVQVRLAAVLEKSIPLQGAAADATETIEGATLRLNRSIDELLVVYGEQANYTKMLIILKTKLIETLLLLPKPLISFIGTMQDFVGTVLIVIGSILKWTFTLLGLVLAFKFLTSALQTYLGISITVSSVMSVILKRIVPLIGFIMVMQRAWEELNESTTQFSKTLNLLAKNMGLISSSAEEAGDKVGVVSAILSKIFGAAVASVKIALTGLVEAILLLQVGFINLKKLFSSTEDAKIYEMMIDDIDSQINNLASDLKSAFHAVNIFSNGTAQAKDNLDNLGDALTDNRTMAEKFRDRVIAAAKVINKGFDESIERQKVMGDEFQRSSVTILETANKIKNVFNEKSSEEDTATKLAELQIKLINDKLQAEKLSFDTFKDIQKQSTDLEIEALKANGKNIEAIKIEYAERKRLLQLQIDGVASLGAITPKQLAAINKVKNALKKAEIAAIMDSGTANKVDQLTKEYQALNEENIDGRTKVNSLYQNEFELIQSQLDASLRKNKIEIDSISLQEESIKKTMAIGKAMGASTEEMEKQKKLLELTSGIKAGKVEKSEIITEDAKNKVQSAGMNIANSIIGAMASGADSVVGQIITSVGTMFGPIGQLVAGLVNVFRKGYDFMKGLAKEFVKIVVELPLMITEGIVGMVDGLIEGFINMLSDPKKLGRILTAWETLLPKIITSIANALPDILKTLFSIKFWVDIISGAFVALRDSFLKMWESIAIAIRDTFANIFSSLGKMFGKSIKDIPKKITTGFVEGVKAGIDALSGFGQKVFSVVADTAGMGGDESSGGGGKNINEAIKKADSWWVKFKRDFSSFMWGFADTVLSVVMEFTNMVTEIWLQVRQIPAFLIEAISTFVKMLWEGILSLPGFLINAAKGFGEALIGLIMSIGEIVKNAIVDPLLGVAENLLSVFTQIGTAVLEKIVDPILKLFTDGIKFFTDIGKIALEAIVTPIKNAFDAIPEMFKSLPGILASAFKTVFDFFINLPKMLLDSFSGLGGMLKGVFESLKGVVKGAFIDPFLNIGSMIKDGINSAISGMGSILGRLFDWNPGNTQGTVESWAKFDIPILRFAEGGNVPGNAKVFGNSFKNDNVPALLSPGEYVLPRSITQNKELFDWIMRIVETGQMPEMHAFNFKKAASKITLSNTIKGASTIIKEAGNVITDVGNKTGINQTLDKVVSTAVPQNVKDVYDWIKRTLGSLNYNAFLKDPIGEAKKMFEKHMGGYVNPQLGRVMQSILGNKFHNGGLVGGYAFGGEVPAMLQSGEFVMNRRAVSNIGESNLGNMNLGRSGSMGDTTINIDLKIETEQPIDEAFIKSKLIPSLRKELKDSSLRGEFVMSQKGIR